MSTSPKQDPLFDCTVQQVIDACSQATTVDTLVQSLIKTVISNQGSPDATFRNHLQWVCEKLVADGVLAKTDKGKLGRTIGPPVEDYAAYSVLLSGRNEQFTPFRRVLLIVAIPDELVAVQKVASEFGGCVLSRQTARSTYKDHQNVYELSRMSGFRIDVLPASMGPFGPRSIGAMLTDYLTKNEDVELVTLVGTAFGVSEKKQNVGDVLIGTSVFLYDRRKVEDKKRGFETPYSPKESPVERGAQNDWIPIFEKWGRKHKKKIGCVLTGGAIVESKKFRDSLRKKANNYLKQSGTSSRVVGGEMEAAGLTVLSATAPRALSWVVVKAVMDFGTAASRTGVQPSRQTAATNAVDAVFRVLRFAV